LKPGASDVGTACWEWAVAVMMARRIEAKVFARMISA